MTLGTKANIHTGHLMNQDLSQYTTINDWSQLGRSNNGIAYIRTTSSSGVSNNHVDTAAQTNVNNAKAQGLKIGCYHYACPKAWTQDDAYTQAQYAANQMNYFLTTAGYPSSSYGDLMPIMDMEDQTLAGNSAQIKNWYNDFITRFELWSGVQMGVYTSAFWMTWAGFDGTEAGFIPYTRPLWVAAYYHDNPGYAGVDQPDIPPGWSDYTMWQYDDQTTKFTYANGDVVQFPGVSFDIDKNWIHPDKISALLAKAPGVARSKSLRTIAALR